MTTRKFARGTAAFAVCLMALSGCSSSAPDGPGPNGKGANDSAGQDASGAGVASVDPNDIIVEQKVEVSGSSDDTATIGIHSLSVDGKTQTLRLVITPHFTSVDDDEQISIFDVWGERKFSPQLVDMDHLKVYSPISKTVESWTSDSVYTETKNNEPMVAWAVYAAPEDDIESFDVRLLDSWNDFTDVPISES